MDPLLVSAASGLRARMESLDMLANNIANASTAGYKNDREFYSIYIDAEAREGLSEPAQGTLPVIEKPWTDFSQGNIQATGNQLDLALSGKGFFSVNGPAGVLYTRNGNFHLSTSGAVVTQEGYPVRLTEGNILRTQSSLPLEISTDGTVAQDGAVLGRLEIVNFAETAALSKQGSTFFRPADPNTAPVVPAAVEVQQGKLENSNVANAESAVRLVSLMRQFEMLQKAISLGGEMNRKAIEDVARVG